MALYKGTQKICPVITKGITPTGTINITQNGTMDVTNYASANVNVSSGVDIFTAVWGDANSINPSPSSASYRFGYDSTEECFIYGLYDFIDNDWHMRVDLGLYMIVPIDFGTTAEFYTEFVSNYISFEGTMPPGIVANNQEVVMFSPTYEYVHIYDYDSSGTSPDRILSLVTT